VDGEAKDEGIQGLRSVMRLGRVRSVSVFLGLRIYWAWRISLCGEFVS
jgi:hypothetical protein